MISLRVCAITFDWYPFDVLVRRTAEAAADAGYQVDVICLRQPDRKHMKSAMECRCIASRCTAALVALWHLLSSNGSVFLYQLV